MNVRGWRFMVRRRASELGCGDSMSLDVSVWYALAVERDMYM